MRTFLKQLAFVFIFSLISIFPFTIVSADTTSGLVAHWKFDEGSGTTVSDSAGSFTGNFVESPAWTAGKIGGGLTFDGTRKFVQIPTAPSVVSPYSTSFWFYLNDAVKSQGFIAHGLAAGNNMIFIAGGSIQITSASSGSFRTWCNKPFTSSDLNKWHHLTIIINSTTNAGEWKCYLNGVDVGVRDADNSGTYGNPGNTDWTIGAYSNNSYWLNGAMDDIRIYSRSLTSADVSELYALGGESVEAGGGETGDGSVTDSTPQEEPPVSSEPPSYTQTGSTFNVATCSQSDVQSAIDSASAGDTINVPAGNCTWSTSVNVTKPLSIIGAGSGSGGTKLTATDTLASGFFNVYGITSTTLFRISGFYFDLVNWTPRWGIKMNSGNDLTNIRIDNNIFNQGGIASIEIGGSKGVIDHNYFYNGQKAISFTGGSRAQQDESWKILAAGTGDALFIEDNHFIANAEYIKTYGQEKIGTYGGGKLVIRNNTFDGTDWPVVDPRSNSPITFTPIMTHGSAGAGAAVAYWQGSTGSRRGQSVVEIYNNVMKGKRIDFPITVRGSSNLIWNNTITTTSGGLVRIGLVEEEYRTDTNWNPSRLVWPAEDQVHNTFIWGNTLNGSPLTIENVPGDETTIKLNRDYFMHAPAATGGRETFVCVPGVTECNGASGSYPTDGTLYPTRGTMVFTPSGPNAYYPYTPYTYPHPLVSGATATPRPPDPVQQQPNPLPPIGTTPTPEVQEPQQTQQPEQTQPPVVQTPQTPSNPIVNFFQPRRTTTSNPYIKQPTQGNPLPEEVTTLPVGDDSPFVFSERKSFWQMIREFISGFFSTFKLRLTNFR